MIHYERYSAFGPNGVRKILSELPPVSAGTGFDRDLRERIEAEGGDIPHILHSLPAMTAPGNFEEKLWERIGTAPSGRRTPYWMALMGGWRTLNGMIYLLGGAAALIAVVALSSRWNDATPQQAPAPAASVISAAANTNAPSVVATPAPAVQQAMPVESARKLAATLVPQRTTRSAASRAAHPQTSMGRAASNVSIPVEPTVVAAPATDTPVVQTLPTAVDTHTIVQPTPTNTDPQISAGGPPGAE